MRFLVALSLALLGHFYLFQYSLDLSPETPPQLISDSSVSVTLNESLVNQPSKTHEVESSTVPKPEPEVKPALPAPIPVKKSSPVDKKDLIKPVKLPKEHGKIKKIVEPPPPEEVWESTPVNNNISIENLSKPPQKEKPSNAGKSISKASKQTASSVIKARPLYQYNPKPEYPSLARQRGWEGVVSLLVEVKACGDVASVGLHESCGYKILDKAAVRAVKTWRFIPGTKDGRVVQSTIMIPVHFKLH